MKNLLKLSSISILLACIFLASCSEENMQENMTETNAVVKMRNFAQVDAESDLFTKGEIKADTGSEVFKKGEIKNISNEVSDTWTSTVFKVVDGQMVPCDCDIEDFEITQVFLLNTKTQTSLYLNGSTTNATHTFTGEDVIGIDMNYNGEYVRMSDIDVFSQSQDEEYAYVDELGLEVFANESEGTKSVVYHFPIGSNEDNPENSLSGFWMRIVLDLD